MRGTSQAALVIWQLCSFKLAPSQKCRLSRMLGRHSVARAGIFFERPCSSWQACQLCKWIVAWHFWSAIVFVKLTGALHVRRSAERLVRARGMASRTSGTEVLASSLGSNTSSASAGTDGHRFHGAPHSEQAAAAEDAVKEMHWQARPRWRFLLVEGLRSQQSLTTLVLIKPATRLWGLLWWVLSLGFFRGSQER